MLSYGAFVIYNHLDKFGVVSAELQRTSVARLMQRHSDILQTST